jgi:hypothetical protein
VHFHQIAQLLVKICVMELHSISEFLKFVGPRGQKIMRSVNYVGNASPHVRQTFLNDVFTFLTEVGLNRNGFSEGNDTNQGCRVFLFY